ncbi:hypothetical protein T439DRAFT_237473 [Meredithblackwellia eburnea MCA 4105]
MICQLVRIRTHSRPTTLALLSSDAQPLILECWSPDQRRQAVNMWFIDGAVPAFDFVVVLYSLVATLDLDETVRARIRYREMKRLDEYDRTLARDSETKPGPEDAVYFQKSKKWKAIIVFNVFAFVFLLAGPIIFTIQQYAQHDLLGKEYYPLIIAVNCTSLVLYIALGAVCYTFYRDYGKWSKKAYKSLLASEKAYVAKERQKPKKLARKNWDKASGSTDDTDKSDQHDTKGKKTWR